MKAATELFLSDGFERISIDKIAAKARVSKTSIYQQFGGKEPLFDAVIGFSSEGVNAPALEPIDDDYDIHAVLSAAARSLTFRILQPEALRVMRLALGGFNSNPRLGQVFWDHGPVHVAHTVAEVISREKRKRRLRKIDPHALSIEFVNLALGRYLFTLILGVTVFPSKKDLDTFITEFVEEFLDRHGLSE